MTDHAPLSAETQISTKTYSHLWNDLPFEERKRLQPWAIETHLLHLQQTRAVIAKHHARMMAEIDDHIKNVTAALNVPTASLTVHSED